MLIFSVGDCVPSPSCLVEGHPTQPGECVGLAGIPDAQDLYASPRVLWTSGALQRFIKGFANIAHPLYDMLGKEVKMGPVDLPPEAREAVAILKGKVQSAPVLVFPVCSCWKWMPPRRDWERCSQKQSDGWYHPIAFGSHSLTPAEKNYHSSKLEFFTLKWSVMEHFKEYLTYASFVVWTDNNLLTYVLTMPNLDAMGH